MARLSTLAQSAQAAADEKPPYQLSLSQVTDRHGRPVLDRIQAAAGIPGKDGAYSLDVLRSALTTGKADGHYFDLSDELTAELLAKIDQAAKVHESLTLKHRIQQQRERTAEREQAQRAHARALAEVQPRQIELLAAEPMQLYHLPLQVPATFALCKRGPGQSGIHQDFYPFEKLDWVCRQVYAARDLADYWISQATLRGNATNRRLPSIILLNAAWVDIDLLHPPKSFPAALLPPQASPEQQAALLAAMIEDAGLPAPSYIVWTGGGLCPKWLFTDAVPSAARPRWQTLQSHLTERVGALRWHAAGREISWPVDRNACDASRILRLVGTVNPRWGSVCRIVFETGLRMPFDDLADRVLPWSRAQVQQWMKDKAAREQWDRNRQAAAALGISRPAQTWTDEAISAGIEDEAVRTLWNNRADYGRAVLELRRGAQVGHRNAWWWPLANALAYSCGGLQPELTRHLAALHQDYFAGAGWTYQEAMQSAGSVMRRVKTGDLYRMKTRTFLDALEVTPGERQQLAEQGITLGGSGHNAKREQWQHGVMGFQKMEGLELDEFVAETRRRQAEAGRRSAEVRNTTRPPEMRAMAREMASRGMTLRAISDALGVALGTVHAWLK